MDTSIKVLLVEDTIEDAELLIREMRKGGLAIVHERVETRDGLEEALQRLVPDVILSDYSVPGFGGMSALEIVRQRQPETPFIFVSGTIGEERAIEALRQGATDYVLKDHRARLVPAIRRALEDAADRKARQRAERDLEESEKRFRLFMQHLPGVAVIKDLNGNLMYANEGAEKVIGKRAGDAHGMHIEALFPPLFAAQYQANDRVVVETGMSLEAIEEVPRDDGVHLHMTTRFPIRDADARMVLLGAISLDMTERLRAEQAQRASEERFRAVAEASQDWIWDVDVQGIHIYCSPAVASILGYEPEEMVGKNSFDSIHADDRPAAIEVVQRAVAEKRGWKQLVLRWQHKDGSFRALESNALPLLGPDGTVVGFRGADRDITERIEQQQKIERLSRIHAMFSGINSAVVRVRDRQRLLQEACRIAVDAGGFKMAWVGAIDPVTQDGGPIAVAGAKGGYTAKLRLTARAGLPHSNEIPCRALREKRHFICNDIFSDVEVGPLQDDARACGSRALAAFPLLIEGKASEVLVLFAGESDFFDAEEVKLLEALAADLSFALDYLAKEARLNYVSYYDTLTGLAHRHLFFDRLTQIIRSTNSDQHAGVVVVDLQRFRTINDTLGRSAGDQVLREFAGRVQIFGPAATTARIGGDRFAVAVSNMDSESLAFYLDKWIAESHAQPVIVDGTELRVSFKIGIAFFPADGRDAESLFHNAEAALQRAKDTADTYVFYSPEMNARVAERLDLECRLRKAVEHDQFLLHYQPKVDLKTRRILGFEALLRWRDSDNKFVSPLDFIPILEQTGMIVGVGRWVIEQVVADMARWRSLKLKVPPVAVNVSQVQVRQKDFVATVLAALGAGTKGTDDIELEVTESLIMEDMQASIDKLRQLRAAGMRISMDDFGTGFSSLSQIAALPLDVLKIDRAFIAGMGRKTEAMAIVSTIISLARALDIGVVAEGVETEEQAGLLAGLGCDQAQGYLFSRPVPFDEIVSLLLPVTMPD